MTAFARGRASASRKAWARVLIGTGCPTARSRRRAGRHTGACLIREARVVGWACLLAMTRWLTGERRVLTRNRRTRRRAAAARLRGNRRLLTIRIARATLRSPPREAVRGPTRREVVKRRMDAGTDVAYAGLPCLLCRACCNGTATRPPDRLTIATGATDCPENRRAIAADASGRANRGRAWRPGATRITCNCRRALLSRTTEAETLRRLASRCALQSRRCVTRRRSETSL